MSMSTEAVASKSIDDVIPKVTIKHLAVTYFQYMAIRHGFDEDIAKDPNSFRLCQNGKGSWQLPVLDLYNKQLEQSLSSLPVNVHIKDIKQFNVETNKIISKREKQDNNNKLSKEKQSPRNANESITAKNHLLMNSPNQSPRNNHRFPKCKKQSAKNKNKSYKSKKAKNNSSTNASKLVISPDQSPKVKKQIETFKSHYKSWKQPWSMYTKLSGNKNSKRQFTFEERNVLIIFKILYKRMVFDEDFRAKMEMLFNFKAKSKLFTSTTILGTKYASASFSFFGNNCYKCQSTLDVCYRATETATSNKGTTAISYHTRDDPSICIVYKKLCKKCNISYYYNKIKDDNKNETMFLAPHYLPYFPAYQRPSSYLHKSIFTELLSAICHKKSIATETWLFHYNNRFKDAYKILDEDILPNIKIKKTTTELGYKVLNENFWFYQLLKMIYEVNPQKIIVDGKQVPIALKITNEDEKQIKQNMNYITIIPVINNKNDEGNKINDDEDDEITDDDEDEDEDDDLDYNNNNDNNSKNKKKRSYIINEYFKYFWNKYEDEINCHDIKELQFVPTKLDKDDNVCIHPGHFKSYGDGNQKSTRFRCSYSTLLAKLDYLEDKQNANNSNDTTTLNDIAKDENIDYKENYSSEKYSKARYYICTNSPQNGNQHQKGFKTCRHHTSLLIKKYNFLPDEIDLFVDWYQIIETKARLQDTQIDDLIKDLKNLYSIKEDQVSTIKSTTTKKIESLNDELAELKHEYKNKVEKFEKILQNVNKKLNTMQQQSNRHSRRSNYNKTIANMNESSEFEKDTNFMEQLNADIPKDDKTDVAISFIPADVRDLLQMEINNNTLLNTIPGCRKAKNISWSNRRRTNGINGWMTCSGFIIRLREELIRETPTSVILDTADAFTCNPTITNYFNRLEAAGYDMVCRLYNTVNKLFEAGTLTIKQHNFWCYILDRIFIDIWHVATHTDKMCIKNVDTGIFHPLLNKFKHILFKQNADTQKIMKTCNDIVVEQFWVEMNTVKQIKAMTKERFRCILSIKQRYHNENRKLELEKQGWTFIPIEYFKSLRSFNEEAKQQVQSKQQLLEKNQVPLQRVVLDEIHADEVKMILKKKTHGCKRSSYSPSMKLGNQVPSKKQKL